MLCTVGSTGWLNVCMPEDYSHLISSARDYFANDFPNPSGSVCPSRSALDAVIKSGGLPDDDLRAHLIRCSNCFTYFRAGIAARPVKPARPLVWGKAAAFFTQRRAAALLCAGLVGWAVWFNFYQGEPKNMRDLSATPAEPAQEFKVNTPTPGAKVTPIPPAGVESAPRGKPRVTSTPKDSGRTPPGAATSVELDLRDRQLMRETTGESSERSIRVNATRNKLLIKLPEGSTRGNYTVSLVDAFGETLVTQKASSRDGKTVAVRMDMRGLPNKGCRLCVSLGDGIPSCFPLIVTDQ
jgi:hypothetical protein